MNTRDSGSELPTVAELVVDPSTAGISAITSDFNVPSPNSAFGLEFADSLLESPADVPTSGHDGHDGLDGLEVIHIEKKDEPQAPPKTAPEKVKNALREVYRSIQNGSLEGVTMTFVSLENIKANYDVLIRNGISFFLFKGGFLTAISWTSESAFKKFKDLFLHYYGAQRLDMPNMFNQFGFWTYIVRNGVMTLDPKYNKPHARKENYTKRLRVFDCDGLILHNDPVRIAEVKDGQIKSLERAKKSKKRQREDPTGGLELLAEAAREDSKKILGAAAATYADAAALSEQT